MEEKKYLKWYNKVGYGSGDLAANMVYGLLTSFVLIYLTDTVGLNAGIVGTLMMFSKFADGVTDVFFGTLIDKTHSKMGKARPWMLWSYLGNAVMLIAIFAIPKSMGDTAKYAYFFITYTLLNAVFYTANNIAYASLTSLITKNGNERVQMGSIRFMFSLATNLVVASITVNAVASMGGGAAGWRNVAIVYAIIGLIVNTISVLSVKELPEEEAEEGKQTENAPAEKLSLLEAIKLLLANKYYIIIALIYVFIYLLHDLYPGKSRAAGNLLHGKHVPHDHRPCLHAGPGEKNEGDVQGKSVRLLLCISVPNPVYRSRLYGERSADAGRFRTCRPGNQPRNGRPERADCSGFRLHLPHQRKTCGRHHVFLLFPGNQDRQRHRDSPGRMASCGRRLRGKCSGTAPVLHQYA